MKEFQKEYWPKLKSMKVKCADYNSSYKVLIVKSSSSSARSMNYGCRMRSGKNNTVMKWRANKQLLLN